MNCFMGYNPLVSKQVKITVWNCEQDGAIPVAPINPSEGDCFIVYATDEAELANSPTSKKTYSSGSWADAEGGGGGETVFPTFTETYDEETMEEGFSCDMTYAEAKASYNENALGEGADRQSMCKYADKDGVYWNSLVLATTDLEIYDIPEGITEGLLFGASCIFAPDGNYYYLKD